MRVKNNLLIIFIILLATILRFYRVSEFPSSLYWDEVAIGYNAYSILKTGRDEYGKFLPLSFESFQDSKIPGYIYLTVFTEFLFGPTEFAVRLPSVIFGIGETLVIYFLVKELFYEKKGNKNTMAFIASLMFTISPWSLQFSRPAFEANGGLFFSLLGIYFLIYWLRRKKRLILAALSIVISIYFYYQQRIFFPVFLIIFALLFSKEIIARWKNIFPVLILSIILVLPVFYQSIFTSGRLSYVSIFNNQEILKPAVQSRLEENNSLTAKILHNRYFIFSLAILKGYLEHFSPNFLFFDGDPNPRHAVSGVGMLYLWSLPFLLIGLIYLFGKFSFAGKIIIPWLLLGPLTASLATPTPHALRSLLLMPVLLIIISVGIVILFINLKKKISFFLFNLIKIVLVLCMFFFMLYYLHLYYFHEKNKSLSWADGYKQLFAYLREKEFDYEQIYVTGKYWRPYIFMLFYNQYPPEIHQVASSNSKIGKYYFGYAPYDTSNPRYDYQQPSLDDLRKSPSTLLALSPDEVRDDDKVIHTIYSINGKEVFKIIDNSYYYNY